MNAATPGQPDRAPLRVGLLINPIAGIGGPGGYKGSDKDWQVALAAGYTPHAGERAKRFVDEVARQVVAAGAGAEAIRWTTLPGAMGVSGLPTLDTGGALEVGGTTAKDTVRASEAFRDAGVDLLCFVGGDGTATDVAGAVDGKVPCLGVPAGVKITSPVFAHDIEEAAWLVARLRPGFETVARDVTDLDETAYREGRVETRLTGSLLVPLSPAVQGGKVATTVDTPLEPLVEQVLAGWHKEDLYLVGAGSVCGAIKAQFWGDWSLLGIDAIQGDRIVATDLNDRAIAALLQEHRDGPVWLVLSTIGGQGVLLGRGTQVLTADTLRRIGWDHVVVVAPPEKLLGLRGLWVDTGDPELDASAPKYLRVVTGWRETRMVKLLRSPAEKDG